MAKWKGGEGEGASLAFATLTREATSGLHQGRLKHIGGKPARTAWERPRRPGEARGEADWIPTTSHLHWPTAPHPPPPPVGRLGGWRGADLQNLDGPRRRPWKSNRCRSARAFCNIWFYFVLFRLSAFTPVLHVFGPAPLQRLPALLPLRLAETKVCVSLLQRFQKQKPKKSRGCSWGDVARAARPGGAGEERRTDLASPNPRAFSRPLLLFVHKRHF